MKPSKRYSEDARLMDAFREAFVDLCNHARPEEEVFGYRLVSNTDHASWQAKRRAVARAAGAASDAYRKHGGTYTLRNAAYVMNAVDPVINWEMSFKDPEQLSPESVLASVDAAVAGAVQAAEEAAERERGVTGLIAAFIRWPVNLREAVGSESAAQQTAAVAIGIAGQVAVGVVAAGVFAAIVALWNHFA